MVTFEFDINTCCNNEDMQDDDGEGDDQDAEERREVYLRKVMQAYYAVPNRLSTEIQIEGY